ncbi:protein of unknown function [Sterolibacterium denitrificans]|uniref:Uncharacterized protein n=1 Tax=Sterolibacterium denitrificans TaxID=157592 RepID=A0A7Z7MWB5_9PROT|nr:protein of unknown function [Sterolibacterium denitrificans]
MFRLAWRPLSPDPSPARGEGSLKPLNVESASQRLSHKEREASSPAHPAVRWFVTCVASLRSSSPSPREMHNFSSSPRKTHNLSLPPLARCTTSPSPLAGV